MLSSCKQELPKIGFFIHSLDEGGAERQVVELADKVRLHGFDSEVYHFGNRYLAAECARCGVTELQVPGLSRFGSLHTLPLFAFTFRRFLHERHVDVLHSHLLGAVTAGSLAAGFGIRRIGTLHDIYSLEAKPAYAAFLTLLGWTGTKLVTVARFIETSLRRKGRFSPSALRTIYNGIPLPVEKSAEREHIRQSLGIAPETIVIFSAGRLVEIKRFDRMLTALSKLPGSSLLLIAGDGPERSRLEKSAAGLELLGRVRFLGFRSDISALLAAADIFALSSNSEGLSYSILEAMAAGLPVICTDVGGNGELIEDGKTGFLVPREDTARYSEQLEKLIDDRALRSKLGAAARERARSFFSEEQMLAQYIQLYRGG